jgi:serine/threonine protein kinase
MQDIKLLEEHNFKNCKMIGIGVFGKVYVVENENNQKRCVKIIPKNKFNELEWEASQTLKNADCSNIIICSKKIEKNNMILLEMEFMNGGDLKKYIDDKKNILSSSDILDIFIQICLYFILS